MKNHQPRHTISILLPICALLSSCATEDMATFGAVAAEVTSNMATSNGNAASATSLATAGHELMRDATVAPPPSEVAAANPPAPQNAETSHDSSEIWHDELTIKEVVSGKVTPYDGHETNIPGDVIASKMGSAADAQALWGPQGGTVSSYTRSGSGLGETITVVVKFSTVIDTHVFKRNS